MDVKILVTIGPSSLKKEVISEMEKYNVFALRINLSHTPEGLVKDKIEAIQSYTKIPICLDSEGAQMRNHSMANGGAVFTAGDIIKVHFDEIVGDSNNISFSPRRAAKQFSVGDEIRIDFNLSKIKLIERNKRCFLAKVIIGGKVKSNKAADLNREINLDPITKKDRKAIAIGRKMGVNLFALSFSESGENVKRMRELAGEKAKIISKVESLRGVNSLMEILEASDEILIDRGDLSRQVCLEKIPFLQRRIVSIARSKHVPVLVATNLLESMVVSPVPTRAEVNDVISTLLMGADGLVLAAETAIGNFPVGAVEMISKLIDQYNLWTPNTSIQELLNNGA